MSIKKKQRTKKYILKNFLEISLYGPFTPLYELVNVFPSSIHFIETLVSQIQEDVNMTIRKIADRQDYQNLI
jgi:hypothetical protein